MEHFAMKYITPLLLILLCVGCSESKKGKARDIAYFGGEIINPTDDYVLLYRKDKLVDSIKLDEDNRFLLKIKDAENGLYKFYHNPEHQHIYLEKGDSLLLRLNTYEFDESLVYTGVGAEKNNFFIDLYLFNEKNKRPVYNFGKKDPSEFAKKIDSLHQLKLEKQQAFLNNTVTVSKEFKDFINEIIDYTQYLYRETYQGMHNSRFNVEKDDSITVEPSFLFHRKKVNINDEELSYYLPYIHYITQYINNVSYSSCYTKKLKPDEKINTSLTYNKNKLRLIDSLITQPYLRNELLRHTAYSYLRDNHTNIMKNNEFIDLFQKTSNNDKSKEEIECLHRGIRKLQEGKQFSNKIIVYDENHKRVPLITLNSGKGKTVFYFWTSSYRKHKQRINEKIAKLQSKFPNLNAVGISLDSNHRKWKNTIKSLGLLSSTQYRMSNPDNLLEDFALININKLIITDAKGQIVDAFANIYDHDLTDKLK